MSLVAIEPSGAAPIDTPVSTTDGQTILVVEDQPEVLQLLADALRMLGYRVLAAEGPSQGLALGDRHSSEIDLVLTDVIMPEMNGPEFVHQLTVRYPSLRVLYVSGHDADLLQPLGVPGNGAAVLKKPFTIDTLLESVTLALERPATPAGAGPLMEQIDPDGRAGNS
jgi:two-component system cell cycle sensor histidine kinase/response regulator CckA